MKNTNIDDEIKQLLNLCAVCLLQSDENDPDQLSDSEEGSTKGEAQVISP